MEIDEENNESKKKTRNVPDEIWIQIRARLPFQTYLTTRTVSKAWKEIIPYDLRFGINVHPSKPPLCGIFVSSFNFRESTSQNDIVLKYICRQSKRIINLRPGNTIDSDFIIRSGYPKGLYSELSFDFSPINKPRRRKRFFYCIGGGLLLITRKDGTSEVRNPVTKQVVTVPKSYLVETRGFRWHYPNEKTGIVVQYPSSFCGSCRFLVIRFCRRRKVMEVYHSTTSQWRRCLMKLDELHLFEVHWHIQNYVVIYRGSTLCLFILTTGGRGIAIKFKTTKEQGYSFPLPKRVLNGGTDDDNIKICECRNNLHLMYHNNIGFWIWKADSIHVDSWTWVPVLEINQCSRVCRPMGLKRLVDGALNSLSGVCRVVPLTCHSNRNIVFLLIESRIFAYYITKDIVELIVDMKDEEDQRISSIMPFYPCLSNIQPLESIATEYLNSDQ